MKQSEQQEQEFLSVCCSRDYELLTGKKTMTQKDYVRITYLVNALGYAQYLQLLIGRYMDMALIEEEHEEREHESIWNIQNIMKMRVSLRKWNNGLMIL